MSKKKQADRPFVADLPQREAASRGYLAGYNGKPRDSNPYVGTELEQLWYDGWDRVHPEINAMVIEQKVSKRQSAPDSALTSI